MKVGVDLDQDIRRVLALQGMVPDVGSILNGNQGFDEHASRSLIKQLTKAGTRILPVEQPVPRADLQGLAALRRDGAIPIAADEAVRTVQDAHGVIAMRAADVINIKVMKSGLLQAMEIATLTRTHGLGLMIGGMMETRVAMGCPWALVLGLGGFECLDLDTPLLLGEDPVNGGYRYMGRLLQPWSAAGLDMEAVEVGERIVVGK